METFRNEIEGCTDEEFERFVRIFMERRDRAAASAIAAPIDIALAQPSNPPIALFENLVRFMCLDGGKYRGQDGP